MEKTVLITGASSGIGEGCARKFASQGARLILNSRSTDKLTALAEELKEKYDAECYVMPFDVCNREAAAAALNALPQEWKSIDVLINNAGLAIGVDKEHEGSLDEWDVMIDTNIKALLSMTRLVVPGMVERGRGHIINIGSIAGDAAYPGGSVYCATKAAVSFAADLRLDVFKKLIGQHIIIAFASILHCYHAHIRSTHILPQFTVGHGLMEQHSVRNILFLHTLF